MFGWFNTPQDNQESKIEIPQNSMHLHRELTVDDLASQSDAIAAMCLKKCLNDPDELDPNVGQRVCLRRCVDKMFSSVQYVNTVCSYLELKVNKFQDPQTPQTKQATLNSGIKTNNS